MKELKNVAFVSVCFGDARYLEQQKILEESILKIYPLANLLFYYDRIPEKARPMEQSQYGFKVHAIKAAIDKGYKRVIWMDPAMILQKEIDFASCPPVMAVRDDHKLNPFSSDRSVEYFGLTRDIIKEWHLVGGSLYYFDFHLLVAQRIFHTWFTAEENDMFDGVGKHHTGATRGHRDDETCMAFALYMNGIEPVSPDVPGYCIENNPTWVKRHFK